MCVWKCVHCIVLYVSHIHLFIFVLIGTFEYFIDTRRQHYFSATTIGVILAPPWCKATLYWLLSAMTSVKAIFWKRMISFRPSCKWKNAQYCSGVYKSQGVGVGEVLTKSLDFFQVCWIPDKFCCYLIWHSKTACYWVYGSLGYCYKCDIQRPFVTGFGLIDLLLLGGTHWSVVNEWDTHWFTVNRNTLCVGNFWHLRKKTKHTHTHDNHQHTCTHARYLIKK